MLKKITLRLIVLLLLTSCRDLRDHDGSFLKENESFFKYTFENGYDVSSSESKTNNPIGHEPITLYTFEFKDDFGIDRNVSLQSVTSDMVDYEIYSNFEKALIEILEDDISRLVFDNEVLLNLTFKNKQNPNTKEVFISETSGLKLSNVYDFLKGSGAEVYESLVLSLDFENQKDIEKFNTLKQQITDEIKQLISDQYEIEYFVKNEF